MSRGRKGPPRQIDDLRGRVQPHRTEDKDEDDKDRRGEDEGPGNGKTEADRALIFRGNRWHMGRRAVAGWARDGARLDERSGAAPTLADMEMPDREPDLKRQREQRKPCAVATRHRSDALDHSPVRLQSFPAATRQPRNTHSAPNYRGAPEAAPLKSLCPISPGHPRRWVRPRTSRGLANQHEGKEVGVTTPTPLLLGIPYGYRIRDRAWI